MKKSPNVTTPEKLSVPVEEWTGLSTCRVASAVQGSLKAVVKDGRIFYRLLQYRKFTHCQKARSRKVASFGIFIAKGKYSQPQLNTLFVT